MKEALRKAYNKTAYAVLRTLFFWSNDIEFFPDANGWSLTFRYKDFVYKCFNVPFLFHPTNTFSAFLSFQKEFTLRGVTEYVPSFRISKLYAKYTYIPHAKNLIQVLLEESSPGERVKLLAEAFKLTDYFHSKGLIHGDLKPKNILVAPDGRFYVIDFENAFTASSVSDRTVDYRTLIPRLIYLFTTSEIEQAFDSVRCSESIRTYVDRYRASFNVRQLVDGISGLVFETDSDAEGEDIDIYVPDKQVLADIIGRLNIPGLDHFLFFRSPDDLKIFVYNLSGISELDVHFKKPFSKPEFLYAKLVRNPAFQVAVTGPDGAGKTTLLEGFLESSADTHLSHISQRIIHASRLARQERGFDTRFNLLERVLDRFSLGLFTRVVAYARLLQTNTVPIILLDRSFYDPFIQAKTEFAFCTVNFFRVFFPKDITIILLEASAKTIRERKSQLSFDAIENYYLRARKVLPAYCILSAETQKDLRAHFTAVLRYLVLTERRFRV